MKVKPEYVKQENKCKIKNRDIFNSRLNKTKLEMYINQSKNK